MECRKRSVNDVVSELANAQKHVELLKRELDDTRQVAEAYKAGYEAGKLMKALMDGLVDAGLSEEHAFEFMLRMAEALL